MDAYEGKLVPWRRVRELALHYETMLAAKQPAAGGAGAIAEVGSEKRLRKARQ